MALHNIRIKWFYSSSMLKDMERAKLKQLREQREKRRFTEIDRIGTLKSGLEVTSREILGQRRRGFWNRKRGGDFDLA